MNEMNKHTMMSGAPEKIFIIRLGRSELFNYPSSEKLIRAAVGNIFPPAINSSDLKDLAIKCD